MPKIDAAPPPPLAFISGGEPIRSDGNRIGGAVGGLIQAAADPKQAVAEGFPVHSLQRPPGQEPVFGVQPFLLGTDPGGLTVGPGGHHQSVEGLHAPTTIHELHRQPVQQLRMAGACTRPAEIPQGFNDSPAKVVAPDPIDHHPGRQGMVAVHQPFGQGQTSSGLFGSRPGGLHPERSSAVGQHRRHPRPHQPARTRIVSPLEQIGGGGGSAVPKGPNTRLRLLLILQPGDFPSHLLRLPAVDDVPLLQLVGSDGQQLGILFGQGFLPAVPALLRSLQQLPQVSGQGGGKLIQPLLQDAILQGLALFLQHLLQLLDLLFQGLVTSLPLLFLLQQAHGIGQWRHVGQDSLLELHHLADWSPRQPVELVQSPLQEIGKPEVVPLGNGVELVAVTACALERHSQNAGPQDLYFVGDDVETVFHEAELEAGAVGTHAQEAGGDQVVDHLPGNHRSRLVIHQFISGDLLH